MAWEWSHSSEAYGAAYNNLHALPHATLAEIFAEWNCRNMKRWDKNLKFALTLPADVLADAIWEKASEQRTCENGGHDAWMCPCGCHTVSFSGESEVLS